MAARKKRPPVSVSDEFLEFVLDQFAPSVGSLRSRRMFGGIVIYAGDLLFALIDDDVLYLKADGLNRPEFEARGLGPFRPYGDDTQVMQFYEVPAEVLENDDELGVWALRAVSVARRAKKKKR